MSENNNQGNESKILGLTSAEFADLKAMLRYGIIIVTTVAITFIIVALVSRSLGY